MHWLVITCQNYFFTLQPQDIKNAALKAEMEDNNSLRPTPQMRISCFQ